MTAAYWGVPYRRLVLGAVLGTALVVGDAVAVLPRRLCVWRSRARCPGGCGGDGCSGPADGSCRAGSRDRRSPGGPT